MDILFSLGNLLGLRTIWAMFLSLGTLVNIAKKAGYEAGYFFPIRFIASRQMLKGQIKPVTLAFFKAGGQSFRSEKGLRDLIVHVRHHKNPLLAFKVMISLPERNFSLQHIWFLQSRKNSGVPVTIYPPHRGYINGRFWNESKHPLFNQILSKTVQTAPELLGRWGAANSREFVQELLNRKYDFVCLSLGHIRRAPSQGFVTRFEPWKQAFPILLLKTALVQLQISSEEELTAILTGDKDNELVQMLLALRTNNWTGPIIVDISSDLLAKLVKPTWFFITPSQFIEAHRQIREAVSSLF